MKVTHCIYLLLVVALVATVTLVNSKTENGADEDKLQIDVQFEPTDCTVKSKKGDTVSVHYTGTLLATGAKFDSSRDRGQPLDFGLGAGRVIRGWDEGLLDMCVGEKRKLTIPPAMGYGPRGFGKVIPPNSWLVFETELMALN
eukprot:TRINITY_DN36_c0_g1_i2.p1 TRINITY_DN36_c0_g1~~TRINITY_DN36_c0_g1_i2.p1  ORF type:complete len:154 (+),score=27.51 TRINITY_DN36_c0_g1_i2:35-463(+)